MPPRFTFTKGPLARLLWRCMASAISSLPVPLSPVIRTGAFVGATRLMVERMPESDVPTKPDPTKPPNPTKPPLNGEAFFAEDSPGFSPFKGELERVFERLFAVCILSSSTPLSHGFVMKSNAPARMPRTASSMVPHAVIRMHGTSGRNTFICFSKVIPSSPSLDDVR